MKNGRKISSRENEIKLYALLVDQILKYSALMWQIPTALVFGNIVVIEKCNSDPCLLSGLALFNLGMIFVFHRMATAQKNIIDTTKKAEVKLQKYYGEIIPKFDKHEIPISAPCLFTIILCILELLLLLYIYITFWKTIICIRYL